MAKNNSSLISNNRDSEDIDDGYFYAQFTAVKIDARKLNVILIMPWTSFCLLVQYVTPWLSFRFHVALWTQNWV